MTNDVEMFMQQIEASRHEYRQLWDNHLRLSYPRFKLMLYAKQEVMLKYQKELNALRAEMLALVQSKPIVVCMFEHEGYYFGHFIEHSVYSTGNCESEVLRELLHALQMCLEYLDTPDDTRIPQDILDFEIHQCQEHS